MIANTTNTFRQQKIATTESYASALDKLQDQINSISKNITYLDVYNIIDTVESKDELNVKVAGLINNSSLVINCPTFQEGDEEYATGDIVLKNNNGEVIHIEAQPGGVYYPEDISNSGSNIIIQYKYATNTPEENSKYQEEEETTPPDGPKETMSFMLELPESSSNIYGHWQNTNSFQKQNNIPPQIQVWFARSSGNDPVEQVYCDFVLSEGSGENKGKYIVSNLPTDVWIKVK